MFPPISDFNFVFAGIATVAATVGYAFTRNKGMGPEEATSVPSSPSPSSFEVSSSLMQEKPSASPRTPVVVVPQATRRGSLKRKVPDDGFDEPTSDIGYPFNLANIYPNKRCKTPPSPSPVEEADAASVASQWRPLPPLALPNEDIEIPHVETEDKQGASQALLPDLAIPQGISPSTPITDTQTQTPTLDPPRTPSPPPVAPLPAAEPTTIAVPEQTAVFQPSPQTPPPSLHAAQSGFLTGTLTPPLTRPSTPNAQFGTTLTAPRFGITTPSPFASSSSSINAFSAFAGSTSPFASVKKGSFGPVSGRTTNAFGSFAVSSQNGSPSAFGGVLSGQSTGAEGRGNGKKRELDHAIGAVEVKVKEAQVKVTHVTGEEEEDVDQELKGVKLFVKRGNKPFASGMVGHLKLLVDRKTLKERLLFRREPLWQVSMNVKVNSTVRCTYEREENAIRLVLKEPVEGQMAGAAKEQQVEVVVYALKPGRACSKQDFKDFAESLVDNMQFTKVEDVKRSA